MSAAMSTPAMPLAPMTVADLDAVVGIEQQAYPFPWSRGNFVDSLAAGYMAEVLLEARGHVIGYYVAMHGVQETHLLNLTVAPGQWSQGHGRQLLGRVVDRAQILHSQTLWLEVRESNARARAVYQRYGFVQVGTRRGYYPAPQGQREDAMVMSLALTSSGASHGMD